MGGFLVHALLRADVSLAALKFVWDVSLAALET